MLSMLGRYIIFKNGFGNKPSERYVRDGKLYVTDRRGTLEKTYNEPVIEEIRLFSLKKIDLKNPLRSIRLGSDPDTALLIRNLFEYGSRRDEFNDVTRASDARGLEVPFDPENERLILYSETEKGEKLFTFSRVHVSPAERVLGCWDRLSRQGLTVPYPPTLLLSQSMGGEMV